MYWYEICMYFACICLYLSLLGGLPITVLPAGEMLYCTYCMYWYMFKEYILNYVCIWLASMNSIYKQIYTNTYWMYWYIFKQFRVMYVCVCILYIYVGIDCYNMHWFLESIILTVMPNTICNHHCNSVFCFPHITQPILNDLMARPLPSKSSLALLQAHHTGPSPGFGWYGPQSSGAARTD